MPSWNKLCFVTCMQVCGCVDDWSQLESILAVLRVLVDLSAESAWIGDVFLHRRDVAHLVQSLLGDCGTAADLQADVHGTTQQHEQRTALMSDARRILTLL